MAQKQQTKEPAQDNATEAYIYDFVTSFVDFDYDSPLLKAQLKYKEAEAALALAREELDFEKGRVQRIKDAIGHAGLILEARPYDDALRSVLTRIKTKDYGHQPNGAVPWATLKKDGATDAQIKANLSKGFGNGYKPTGAQYHIESGKFRYYPLGDYNGRDLLTDADSINEVRRVLEIPLPGAKASTPTKKPAPKKPAAPIAAKPEPKPAPAPKSPKAPAAAKSKPFHQKRERAHDFGVDALAIEDADIQDAWKDNPSKPPVVDAFMLNDRPHVTVAITAAAIARPHDEDAYNEADALPLFTEAQYTERYGPPPKSPIGYYGRRVAFNGKSYITGTLGDRRVLLYRYSPAADPKPQKPAKAPKASKTPAAPAEMPEDKSNAFGEWRAQVRACLANPTTITYEGIWKDLFDKVRDPVVAAIAAVRCDARLGPVVLDAKQRKEVSAGHAVEAADAETAKLTAALAELRTRALPNPDGLDGLRRNAIADELATRAQAGDAAAKAFMDTLAAPPAAPAALPAEPKPIRGDNGHHAPEDYVLTAEDLAEAFDLDALRNGKAPKILMVDTEVPYLPTSSAKKSNPAATIYYLQPLMPAELYQGEPRAYEQGAGFDGCEVKGPDGRSYVIIGDKTRMLKVTVTAKSQPPAPTREQLGALPPLKVGDRVQFVDANGTPMGQLAGLGTVADIAGAPLRIGVQWDGVAKMRFELREKLTSA